MLISICISTLIIYILNFEIMHGWLCKPERQNNGSVLIGCTSRHDGPIQQEKL